MATVQLRLWLEVDEAEWSRRYGAQNLDEVREQVKDHVVGLVRSSRELEEGAILHAGRERARA